MLRYLFAFVLFIHGLIHFWGFSKAFGYTQITEISKEISKGAGVLWMITGFLFVAATILFLLKKEWWWMIGFVAVIASQVVIIQDWQEARYGTVANIIILTSCIIAFGTWSFERSYKKDVSVGLQRTSHLSNDILTEADILHLPTIVQKYLHYTGVMNHSKVKNVEVVFEGELRSKGKDWFSFTSEQYDFFDVYTRLFFMEGRMYGIKVPGYHAYKNGKATMNIKMFGLIPFIREKGEKLDKAETVTLFNDMCFLAPASLIDKQIKWKSIEDLVVKAWFTVNNITISAQLYFNEKGQLINFISEDRYALPDMKQYKFSTPVMAYRNINGFNLVAQAEAIWHYPEAAFPYGRFRLKNIRYNTGIWLSKSIFAQTKSSPYIID